MNKFLNIIKTVALYIWQLPQNLLGLILLIFYKAKHKYTLDSGVTVYFCSYFPGGISLGQYSIVNAYHYRTDKDECLKRDTIKHEAIGHAKQSMMLGPLYLIVIGLPSLIWAWLYGPVIPYTPNGYYKFYTEKWADKLADVQR